MTFEEFLKLYRSQHIPLWKPPKTLLALDPGETLGWARFSEGSLKDFGETSLCVTKPFLALTALCCGSRPPDVIVSEDYKVYPWRLREHSWSTGYTMRILGMLEGIAEEHSIILFKQMALSPTKGFCHNRRLREWGYYIKGGAHARDAIRHGCYWLLFSKEDYRQWEKS